MQQRLMRRDLPGQHERHVPLAHTKPAQPVGKTGGHALQIGKAQLQRRA